MGEGRCVGHTAKQQPPVTDPATCARLIGIRRTARAGQQALTGTWVQTTRGTHCVTVYGTCLAT